MSRKSRWVSIVLFTNVVGLMYLSCNLMAPNLTAIARSLGMSDREKDSKLAGTIAAAFYLVGGPSAVLSGYMAGRASRKGLASLMLLLGGGAMIGTNWVKTYGGLFAAQVLLGK